MSTALAPVAMNVPDFLRTPELAAAAARFNAAVSGGIKVGGFARLGIKGGKFFIVDSTQEPKERLITVKTDQGDLPAMALDVVIVGGNPGVSKVFYAKKWEAGDDSDPDCSSDNGITPDAHVATPQSNACAGCPKNQWGSKITEDGKEAKACADNKRIALLPVADLKFKPLGLQIPPASLKEFGVFTRSLDRAGAQIPIYAVICRITFDPTVSYPRLKFTYAGFLTQEQFTAVQGRLAGDDVAAIVMPVRPAAAPLALPAPTAPALAAPPVIQQPVAAPPAQPAAPAVSFGAPPAPAPQPAPVFVPPPAPPAPPAAPEYPAHVVAAVTAAGGFDSPVGQAVLAAMMPGAVGGAAPAAEAPKRTRGRPAKTETAAAPATASFGGTPAVQPAEQAPAPAATFAAPPAAPVQQAPAPAAAPAASFAVAPPQNTGQAADLDSQLKAIFGG